MKLPQKVFRHKEAAINLMMKELRVRDEGDKQRLQDIIGEYIPQSINHLLTIDEIAEKNAQYIGLPKGSFFYVPENKLLGARITH